MLLGANVSVKLCFGNDVYDLCQYPQFSLPMLTFHLFCSNLALQISYLPMITYRFTPQLILFGTLSCSQVYQRKVAALQNSSGWKAVYNHSGNSFFLMFELIEDLAVRWDKFWTPAHIDWKVWLTLSSLSAKYWWDVIVLWCKNTSKIYFLWYRERNSYLWYVKTNIFWVYVALDFLCKCCQQ